jgi:hypothetical protein
MNWEAVTALIAAGVALIVGTGSAAASVYTVRKVTAAQRQLARDQRIWQKRADAFVDGGIDMVDLTGSGGIASSTISGSSETNLRIENNTATALTAFNVTASTISNTSTVTGDDGILILNDGSSAMTVSVTRSTFTDNKGDHFQAHPTRTHRDRST